ncbi:MAG: amidase [Pseudomonadota bacterium]|nr:amidase [Pseudomonadota bacterium]
MTITIDSRSAKQSSTVATLAAAIAAGRDSCVAALARTRESAERHAVLNALAWVDWPAAEADAARIDADIAAGRLSGPLAGVPISIKDLYLVDGMPTRAGTRARLPDLGKGEASLVTRLRQAGALIFAKTNMHEIALGASGENPWTGDVLNPFDHARQSGGSSSGAGAAVAVGIGAAGIGSDTGGSVRIPASFCGITGFKPSFGAIPLDGALHLSFSFDHAGPLAPTVDDCAILYEVMSGRSARAPAPTRAPRLGVPRDWLAGRLSVEVRDAFERTLALLRVEGVSIVELPLPALGRVWNDCYTPIVRAEAAWVHREALAAGGEGFSEGVLAPMRVGAALMATDYIEARRQRERIRAELDVGLAGVDAVILPASGVAPPLRGQMDIEVESGRTTVREAVLGQTAPFSACGLPALSLPWARIDGLPVGLQVVGAGSADAGLLSVGRWIERLFATRVDESLR